MQQKLGFILLCTLIMPAVMAQVRLDELNDDSSVRNFVVRYNYVDPKTSDWQFFHLPDGKELSAFRRKLKQPSFVLEEARRWAKADLDDDGDVDLVVSGMISKPEFNRIKTSYYLLVFMAEKNSCTELNL